MDQVNDNDVVDSGGDPIIEMKQEAQVEFDEVQETMEFGLFGGEEEVEIGNRMKLKLKEEELDYEQEEVIVKLEPKQEMFDDDALGREEQGGMRHEIKKEEMGMGSSGEEELKNEDDEDMSPQLQPTPMLLTLHISKETRANPRRKEIEFKAVPLVDPRKRNRNAVPDSAKDVKYYKRCAKNAAATARTRQIKRIKMRQLAARAEFLEKACNELQDKIQAVKSRQPINSTNYAPNTVGDGLSKQILELENIYNQQQQRYTRKS